jgi:alpha-beta hydrolase superfamily lysophospholipase
METIAIELPEDFAEELVSQGVAMHALGHRGAAEGLALAVAVTGMAGSVASVIVAKDAIEEVIRSIARAVFRSGRRTIVIKASGGASVVIDLRASDNEMMEIDQAVLKSAVVLLDALAVARPQVDRSQHGA